MMTAETLAEIEAAATVQPGAAHSNLLGYADGDVHGLVLALVAEIRRSRPDPAGNATCGDADVRLDPPPHGHRVAG